jgi:Flp pilus assembly protein TadD
MMVKGGAGARSIKARALVALLLAVGTLLFFWPATRNGFVFDDRSFMLREKRLVAGLTGEGISWALKSTDISLYVPLTRLSTMLDFQLYGAAAWGHHLTNLLLHAANGSLLFLALAALTGALWRSAGVAVLFAVHPMHVEPVAWVSGRADLLAAFFGLLTLLAWRRHLGRPGWPGTVLTALLFFLGMASKGIIVMLPFALLLLDFWPLGRLKGFRAGWRASAVLVREKAALFAVTALMTGVMLYSLIPGPFVVSTERYPLAARAATSCVSYATYLGKTFWPTGLAVFYPQRWGAIPGWEWGGAALLILGVSAGAILAARRFPYLPAGWFWFLGTLLPVIGLFQAREYAIADRYSYLPRIGIFVVVVWGLSDLVRARRWSGAVGAAAVAAAVLACLPVSAAQLGYWRDDLALFGHALDVTSGNWVAHNGVGLELVARGDVEGGIAHYRKAIAIRPGYVEGHNNLGVALAALGRRDEAIASYRAAVRLNPRFPDARYNLGNALAALGRDEEAAAEYRSVLETSPGHTLALTNLALVLARRGEYAEAEALLREALRLSPGEPVVRTNLEAVLHLRDSPP